MPEVLEACPEASRRSAARVLVRETSLQVSRASRNGLRSIFILRGHHYKSGTADYSKNGLNVLGIMITTNGQMQYWSVWYPEAAATGVLLARGRIEAVDTLLVHAAPNIITVEVFDEEGKRVAYGKDLKQEARAPISRLRHEGDRILREVCWPTEKDIGSIVLLMGGEAGILKSWWNSEDKKEWRWQVEFYNSMR